MNWKQLLYVLFNYFHFVDSLDILIQCVTMQEHKSFLIRDLLGDVLAERVQGESIITSEVKI